MVDAMKDRFGIKVQPSTVYNTLKRRGWRKKVFNTNDRQAMTNMSDGEILNLEDFDAMGEDIEDEAIDQTLDDTILTTAVS